MKDFTKLRKTHNSNFADEKGALYRTMSENRKFIKLHAISSTHARSLEDLKLAQKRKEEHNISPFKKNEYPLDWETNIVLNAAYTGASIYLSIENHKYLVELLER